MTSLSRECRSLTPGDVLCRRYVVERLAGVGAMGEVFVVDDTWLRTLVAFKVPSASAGWDPADRERLRSEAIMALKVAHSNVCRVYDVVEHGGMVLLKMELVSGETLAAKLAPSEPRLDDGERLRIAFQVCAGLDAIHHAGVVHRDLKPSNVMVDRHGRAVIIDFGIADHACAPTSPRSGTQAYMAPEQLAGRHGTASSDLYGLGLTLFELFVGHPPFAADDLEALLRLQRRGPRFPHGEGALRPAVERVVRHCLMSDPSDRPASARTVGQRLLDATAAEVSARPIGAGLGPIPADRPPVPAGVGRRRRMRRRRRQAGVPLRPVRAAASGRGGKGSETLPPTLSIAEPGR